MQLSGRIFPNAPTVKVRQLREVVGAVQQSGDGGERGVSRAAGGRPSSAVAVSVGGGASATSSMRAELSASRRYGGMCVLVKFCSAVLFKSLIQIIKLCGLGFM